MNYDGMDHAFEEIRRLLKPAGFLIDIHPIPEGYFIEVNQGGKVLFSERKRETCSEDVLHAEDALERAVERGLFTVETSDEFDFLTYGSSVSELRAYWAELNAYEKGSKDEALVAREEDLYAQVENLMKVSGAGVEVAIHEKARIARLRPV